MAINDAIGAQPVQQEAPVDPAQQDDTAVTPEQQDAYEKVVLGGVEILSDEKTNPQIMTMLEQGGDPAQNAADVTGLIFGQLDEKSKGTIPIDVVANASGEILQNVVEFANAKGVAQIDKPTQDKATQLLWIKLQEMGYDIDPDETMALGEGMDEQSLQAMVKEQDSAARSGGAPQEPQAAPAPQAQPAQQLPGIINQTIGG